MGYADDGWGFAESGREGAVGLCVGRGELFSCS